MLGDGDNIGGVQSCNTYAKKEFSDDKYDESAVVCIFKPTQKYMIFICTYLNLVEMKV